MTRDSDYELESYGGFPSVPARVVVVDEADLCRLAWGILMANWYRVEGLVH